MYTPTEFLVAITGLSVVNQQVVENCFGPFLHAHLMRVAAIGTGVGLAFGVQQLGLFNMDALTTWQTVALGGISGLGSNVVHALWERFAPTSGDAPVVGILTNLAGKGEK